MQDILVTWNRLRQDDENEDHWWQVRIVEVEEEYESAQREVFSMEEAMIQRDIYSGELNEDEGQEALRALDRESTITHDLDEKIEFLTGYFEKSTDGKCFCEGDMLLFGEEKIHEVEFEMDWHYDQVIQE